MLLFGQDLTCRTVYSLLGEKDTREIRTKTFIHIINTLRVRLQRRGFYSVVMATVLTLNLCFQDNKEAAIKAGTYNQSKFSLSY